MKNEKIFKCKRYCNQCSQCKAFLRKNSRAFCGHFWPDVQDETMARTTERDLFEQRIKRSASINYCQYQLERGQQGKLHYQVFIKTIKPIRRSKLKAILQMKKGEWIEPVSSENAQKNYTEKDKTRVDGPWYLGLARDADVTDEYSIRNHGRELASKDPRDMNPTEYWIYSCYKINKLNEFEDELMRTELNQSDWMVRDELIKLGIPI